MTLMDTKTTMTLKLDKYRQLAHQWPDDLNVRLALAETAHRRGFKLEALEGYQRVLASVSVVEAHLAMAQMYWAQSLEQEALEELSKIFVAQPGYAEAHIAAKEMSQKPGLLPDALKQALDVGCGQADLAQGKIRLDMQRSSLMRESQELTQMASQYRDEPLFAYYMNETRVRLQRVDDMLKRLQELDSERVTRETEQERQRQLEQARQKEFEEAQQREQEEVERRASAEPEPVVQEPSPLELELAELVVEQPPEVHAGTVAPLEEDQPVESGSQEPVPFDLHVVPAPPPLIDPRHREPMDLTGDLTSFMDPELPTDEEAQAYVRDEQRELPVTAEEEIGFESTDHEPLNVDWELQEPELPVAVPAPPVPIAVAVAAPEPTPEPVAPLPVEVEEAIPTVSEADISDFYTARHAQMDALIQTLAKTRGVTSIYVLTRYGMLVGESSRDAIAPERISELVVDALGFLEAYSSRPQYWVLECSGGIVVMQSIDDNHVLIAIGQAGANFGALRYTMDKVRPSFAQLVEGAPLAPPA